jgi:hypothetical protein
VYERGPGETRGGQFRILFLTLLCKRIVRVARSGMGGWKGEGGKVTKGWRQRSATRIVVGYSRPESTVSGEEWVERRPGGGRDAIGY